MRTRARGKEQKGKKTKDKPCKVYIFTEGDTEEIYLKHYENKKKGIEVISVESWSYGCRGNCQICKEIHLKYGLSCIIEKLPMGKMLMK